MWANLKNNVWNLLYIPVLGDVCILCFEEKIKVFGKSDMSPLFMMQHSKEKNKLSYINFAFDQISKKK